MGQEKKTGEGDLPTDICPIMGCQTMLLPPTIAGGSFQVSVNVTPCLKERCHFWRQDSGRVVTGQPPTGHCKFEEPGMTLPRIGHP